MDLNKVMLIGNVGQDPEIKTLPSGKQVVNFSVATNRSWIDKASGERKQDTQWHRVNSFNEGIVEIVGRYVAKGSRVYIEGEVRYRKFNDANGVEKWTTDIVIPPFGGQIIVLGGGKQASGDTSSFSTRLERPAPPQARAKSSVDFDDDIPF